MLKSRKLKSDKIASRISTPKNLDISPNNRTFNWESFKQTWLNYEIATELNEKTDQMIVATLLNIIGNDALQVYNAFVWNEHLKPYNSTNH